VKQRLRAYAESGGGIGQFIALLGEFNYSESIVLIEESGG